MPSHFKNANNFDNYHGDQPSKKYINKLREHIAAGALHNSVERCDAPKCHPETRVAVQDEVVSWICDGDRDGMPKKIMWVTGPAGAGKTAIMGSVADTCQRKGILGATHFFSSFSGPANRRSKQYLVPTLAYQLVQHKALYQVAEHVLSAVEHNPAVFEQSLEVQLDQLILEPLRACRDRPNLPEWPKVILIDGLDECEADQYLDTARSKAPLRSNDDDQTEILSMLKIAASDPDFPFRIVVASRPEHTIKLFFTDVAWFMTRELFLDRKYDPDADMALYLESKFANIRRQSHLPSSWPGPDVSKTLITNASGQFVYVATVGRIMEGSGGDPDQLLKQVLGLPGIAASTNVLAPLDALYTHILSSNPDSDAHLSILWLNLMFRERYLDSISGVLASAVFVCLILESYPGQASHLFRNLHSLVSISTSGSLGPPYRLYHKSMVDFMQERSRSGTLYVEPKVVSEFLASRYLSVWKSRGPDRSLTGLESKYFFENFFLENIVSSVFTSENFTRLDELLLSCDVNWWTSWYTIAEVTPLTRKASINSVFCAVHTMCRWYRQCRPSCRHIRSGLIKGLQDANWKTPSTSHLLRHKFLHLDETAAGFEAPKPPSAL